MKEKLILPKISLKNMPVRQTAVKVSPEAYITAYELSCKTGLSMQEIVSRLVLFAAENVEIEE